MPRKLGIVDGGDLGFSDFSWAKSSFFSFFSGRLPISAGQLRRLSTGAKKQTEFVYGFADPEALVFCRGWFLVRWMILETGRDGLNVITIKAM